jgi:branched-chain amino acid aminotransferase
MDSVLLKYFVFNDSLVSTSDFNYSSLSKGFIIYEVIRVTDGKPLFLKEHIQRFFGSLNNSITIIDISCHDIVLNIKSLITANNLNEGNIWFQVNNANDGQVDFAAWIIPHYYPSPENYQNGVNVATVNQQRQNPSVKLLNHSFKSIIKSILIEKQVFEVLLVTDNGYITEGSRSNVFFIKDDTLFTSRKTHVLSGITRAKVCFLAKYNHVDIKETEISTENLASYDSAFITSTSVGILPVLSIDKHIFNVNKSITQLLMFEYDKLTESNIKNFSWENTC